MNTSGGLSASGFGVVGISSDTLRLRSHICNNKQGTQMGTEDMNLSDGTSPTTGSW